MLKSQKEHQNHHIYQPVGNKFFVQLKAVVGTWPKLRKAGQLVSNMNGLMFLECIHPILYSLVRESITCFFVYVV